MQQRVNYYVRACWDFQKICTICVSNVQPWSVDLFSQNWRHYFSVSYYSKPNCKRHYFELWYWSTSPWHTPHKKLEIPIGPPDLENDSEEWIFGAHQDHPFIQAFESDNSKLFAISTEPLRLTADDTSATRHLTLIPNPTRYSPTQALHISYDCLSGEYSLVLFGQLTERQRCYSSHTCNWLVVGTRITSISCSTMELRSFTLL